MKACVMFLDQMYEIASEKSQRHKIKKKRVNEV